MNGVKVWGLSICAAAVVGSLVSMLAPSLEKNKMVKLVISVFVLISIISPMLSLLDKMDFSFDSYVEKNVSVSDYEMTDKTVEMLEKSTCEALYPLIKDNLKKYGIKGDFGLSVEICKKDAGFEVVGVNINIDSKHMIDKDALSEEFSSKFGLDIDFIDYINPEEKQK